MDYDVIVCGAGVQGLWTANHLVEQKKKVLLLEQFPFPHSRGSSHGPSRITRYSYSTLHHAKMMIDAFKLWNKLETLQKAQLFVKCGLLSILPAEKLANLKTALGEIDKDFEELEPGEIPKKFPGMADVGCRGVYESTAGVLKSNKCLEALQRNYLHLGGIMLDGTKVELLKPLSDDLVEVATNKGIYRSKSVVLTCGSWINQLLQPLNLHLPVKAFRVDVSYWRAKDPKLYDVRNFPTTIIHGVTNTEVYSTPILEYPGVMKVCSHNALEVDPDATSRVDPEQLEMNKQRLKSMVELCFPNLLPECVVQETCLYTRTPDRDFIIDRHPRHKNIIIGAGFSGHGFKISPVVGKLLSDLATGKQLDHEIKPFSLSRFKLKSTL